MQQNIYTILKNGYYIPLLFPLVYYYTNHLLLSTTITLKMFPANYMFWYSHKFNYGFADRRYNQIKQVVRFTDTGYLASILAIQSPAYLPFSFNIHFAITFGYWIAKGVLGLDDVDRTNGPTYDIVFEKFWGAIIHGIPLAILLQKILTTNYLDQCPYYFSPRDLMVSYVWLWVWGVFVYIPWRIKTGDPVYSFMDWKTPVVVKIGGIVLIHALLVISNITGRYICRCK